MRTSGTILLATGFLALTTAVLMHHPDAPDANIGAGILSLAAIPIGGVGLILLIVCWLRRTLTSRAQSTRD